GAFRLGDLIALAEEAIAALDREVVVAGHGLGGLVALSLAANPRIKSAIALAPMIPRFRSPLLSGIANRIALWRGRPLAPPAGRNLFDCSADAEVYQRALLTGAMVRDEGAPAVDVARGDVVIPPPEQSAPRLIIVGEADPFAPIDRVTAMAETAGAKLVTI